MPWQRHPSTVWECSFQLSTSGIIPGEGGPQQTSGLDRNTLKIPVIAIGVPTVAELSALTGEKRGSAEPFMVAPADIDVLVKKSALAIGYGINMAIHGEMSISDMEQLPVITGFLFNRY